MRGRRWNEAQTLKFVKIYRRHEWLWNPDHPMFNQKKWKNKAYADIADEFNAATSITLSIPEVKIKINNLRTTYYQQVNKILQRSTPDAMYEPSLVWFHEMDCCLKRVSVNRRSSGDPEETLKADSSSPVWFYLDQSNEDLDSQSQEEEENNDSSVEESSDKRERSHSPHLKKNKKRKFKLRNAANVEGNSSNTELREDEFDIYGKYIASQLRSLELKKALEIQLEIQVVMSRARMTDIDES